MNNHRWILLAEDNARDADLTLRALSGEPPPDKVVVTGDGAEALDCLYGRGAFESGPEDLPALVLLDLKMPKVDGLEVLRQMRRDPALKHVPVVVFTSSRERKDFIRAYQLGANAYVVKPLGFKEFVSVLRTVKQFWLVANEPPPVDLTKAADGAARPSRAQLATAA
jgi:CheY-like chemotaxis protein